MLSRLLGGSFLQQILADTNRHSEIFGCKEKGASRSFQFGCKRCASDKIEEDFAC
jgi:hypothetical protein